MDAKTFGAFLARVRREQGLTQAELAEQLHVTDKAVSRWERGIGLPDINTLEPLGTRHRPAGYQHFGAAGGRTGLVSC